MMLLLNTKTQRREGPKNSLSLCLCVFVLSLWRSSVVPLNALRRLIETDRAGIGGFRLRRHMADDDEADRAEQQQQEAVAVEINGQRLEHAHHAEQHQRNDRP